MLFLLDRFIESYIVVQGYSYWRICTVLQYQTADKSIRTRRLIQLKHFCCQTAVLFLNSCSAENKMIDSASHFRGDGVIS